jgi:hypothetical protein
LPAQTIFIDSQPDQNNIPLFYQYPALRNPQYWTFDQRGKKYVFDQILAGTLNDPVSLILRGEITPEQQTKLDELEVLRMETEEECLAEPHLCAFIAANQMTPAKLMVLPSQIVEIFQESGQLMTALLTSKLITWEQAASSSMRNKLSLLQWQPIKAAIERGEVSIYQMVTLNDESVKSLNDRCVREGVQRNAWTVQEAMAFNAAERRNIFIYGVPQDISHTKEWQDEQWETRCTRR